MTTVKHIAARLDKFAPAALAEDWDNVGLLVGDPDRSVRRLMTCLTITPSSAAEAVERSADLVVAHHPLPFHPLKRLTTETTTGRMLLELIAARVAIYSPHTAFDSARHGINRQLAEGLGLDHIAPLVPGDDELGSGRFGRPAEPLTLGRLADRLKAFLQIDRLQYVGDLDQTVHQVGVACGAAGELLDAVRQAGCDCMVLGETSFHTCLEAEAVGVSLLLPGHFASERFACQHLAGILAQDLPDVEVWAATRERDPISFA